MNLVIVSWDGHAINDGSNYEASVPDSRLPSAQSVYIMRSGAHPDYSDKQLNANSLPVEIACLGDTHTQDWELRQWFTTAERTPKKLLFKDTDNADKEWYYMGTPDNFMVSGDIATVMLALETPYLYAEVETTEQWLITASGQSVVLSVDGNTEALPVLEIVPTAAKDRGYAYRYWVRSYNPNARAVRNVSIDVTDGGLDTASLVGDASQSNQINQVSGIDAVTLSIPVDTPVGGGLETGGGLCYVDTEQIKYTSISGGVMTVAADGRGYGGTTAASHADNAVLKQSFILANGADLRVYNRGKQLDRWLQGMNTANTKIWTQGLNYVPKLEMTLSGSVAGSGAVTSITIKDTPSNNKALQRLPNRRGIIEIVSGGGTERFVYNRRNLKTRTIHIVQRGVRDSTAVAHADGDTVRFIQFDLWLMAGNSELTEPEVDETRKPAWELSSTNGQHSYTEFGDKAGLRPGAWKGAVISATGKRSRTFSGEATDETADPITALGMRIMAFVRGGIWKSENAEIEWRLDEPGGITTVTSNGDVYREKWDFPDFVGLQKSKDGEVFVEQFNLASPGSAGSPSAWSKPSESLGSGYRAIRFAIDGSLRAIKQNESYLEVDAVTVTLANPIVVDLGTREDHYHLECTIENQETGESLSLEWTMGLTEGLTVDSVEREVTYEDGTNAYRAMTQNTRRLDWLRLLPDDNTLVFTDAGTNGVTVNISYRERYL